MSTKHPMPVGSDPTRDPPETLLEILVQIEHPRGQPTGAMLATVEEVADRLEAALAPARFADLPARVGADVIWPALPDQPLYPVRVGARVFTCRQDVVEAIEALCAGTELANDARDHAGRGYALHVEVSFRALTPADASARPHDASRI